MTSTLPTLQLRFARKGTSNLPGMCSATSRQVTHSYSTHWLNGSVKSRRWMSPSVACSTSGAPS